MPRWVGEGRLGRYLSFMRHVKYYFIHASCQNIALDPQLRVNASVRLWKYRFIHLIFQIEKLCVHTFLYNRPFVSFFDGTNEK